MCACVSWKIQKDKVGQRFKSTTWACGVFLRSHSVFLFVLLVSFPPPQSHSLCPNHITSQKAVLLSHFITIWSVCAIYDFLLSPLFKKRKNLCPSLLWLHYPLNNILVVSLLDRENPRPARLKCWPTGIRFYNSNRTHRFLLMYTQTQPNSTEGSKK